MIIIIQPLNYACHVTVIPVFHIYSTGSTWGTPTPHYHR